MRPRVNFCWLCGRKLWGNKHIETFVDGHIRILHKACHERIERGIDVSGDTLETPGGKLPYGGAK